MSASPVKRPLLWVVGVSFVFLAGFIAGNSNNDITKQVIGETQKLFSLNFTEQEQDSMQDNLREYRKYYDNLHKHLLKNDVNPAIYFIPILVLPEHMQVNPPAGANCVRSAC